MGISVSIYDHLSLFPLSRIIRLTFTSVNIENLMKEICFPAIKTLCLRLPRTYHMFVIKELLYKNISPVSATLFNMIKTKCLHI